MKPRAAKNEEGGSTFSAADDRGRWSKARGHPPDPAQPKTSPTHPSAPRSGDAQGAREHAHPVASPSRSDIVPKTTLRIALSAPELLAGALSGETWHGWRSLLLAAMGEELKPDELETFRRLTERQEPPKARVDELVCVVGRRGGKSRAIATLLCYLACLVNYKPRLASGQTG